MRNTATISVIATLALLGNPVNSHGLISFLGAPAGQEPSARPTTDEILSNYVQALGGAEAFHKLKTRVMKGTIQTVGASELGSVETYLKAPNKGVSTTYIPGDPPSTNGYNGAAGWTIDPVVGPQDVTGPDLDDLKQRFDFYREIRLKEIYPQMAFQGAETVNGRNTYVTEAVNGNSARERFYFDQQTGLLIRQEAISPDGSLSRTVLEDYREVDGVKLPFRVRVADSESEEVFQYAEIRHNISIEDARFEKPAVH